MKKYSVLMPVYCKDNVEYLKLAIDSMINQTLKPDEIVIVKDGKIPSLLEEVINDAKKKFSKIVEVQLKTNVGLGLALNEGLKVCKNELVARMDADDISLPERCEKQVLMFEKNKKLDIVGCPVLEFSDNSNNIIGRRSVPLTNEEIYKYSKKRDAFNHPTVMYKKSKVLNCGGYGDYRKNQDTDLWIKMLSSGAKTMNIDEDLFLFRFDKNTYKKRKNWLNTKTLIKIRWNAYKIGFSSFSDFLIISIMQLAIFVLPVSFQKFVYKKILRR